MVSYHSWIRQSFSHPSRRLHHLLCLVLRVPICPPLRTSQMYLHHRPIIVTILAISPGGGGRDVYFAALPFASFPALSLLHSLLYSNKPTTHRVTINPYA